MMLIIVCDDESAEKIMGKANDLREKNPNEGIFAWISDVSGMTKHDKTNRI